MKKLILFAMLIMASIVAFATSSSESKEPLSLKEQVIEVAATTPTNEVVQSIDYLVDKYGTKLATNETTKIITQEAVENQVIYAKTTLWVLSSALIIGILMIILAFEPYQYWKKRDLEESMQVVGFITMIISSILLIVLFVALPDLITAIKTPHYEAFKEILELF